MCIYRIIVYIYIYIFFHVDNVWMTIRVVSCNRHRTNNLSSHHSRQLQGSPGNILQPYLLNHTWGAKFRNFAIDKILIDFRTYGPIWPPDSPLCGDHKVCTVTFDVGTTWRDRGDCMTNILSRCSYSVWNLVSNWFILRM